MRVSSGVIYSSPRRRQYIDFIDDDDVMNSSESNKLLIENKQVRSAQQCQHLKTNRARHIEVTEGME